MTTKVQKWGNSLALRIPKELVDLIGLTEGKEIELSQALGGILITQKKKKKSFRLDTLLAQVTPENRHPLSPWNDEQGREQVVWED